MTTQKSGSVWLDKDTGKYLSLIGNHPDQFVIEHQTDNIEKAFHGSVVPTNILTSKRYQKVKVIIETTVRVLH